MADLKRYVVGLNSQGKSALVLTGVPNQQSKEDFFWRATLWKTRETPVDNTIGGDRSLEGGAARSPFPSGMLVRVLEFWPDHDAQTQAVAMAELNKVVGQKYDATQADIDRSPTMHKTDTLDVITVVRGEIYLVLEDGEILMKTIRHRDHPRRQTRLEQPRDRAMPNDRQHDRCPAAHLTLCRKEPS